MGKMAAGQIGQIMRRRAGGAPDTLLGPAAEQIRPRCGWTGKEPDDGGH
jgi:hypothetical protein